MLADIRPARTSDVDALVALENRVFEADRISGKSFRIMIASATAAVLVAVAEGALAGYCVVLFRQKSSKARLYSIAAAPGQIGGVGRALLEAAEAAAADRGRDWLRLEVRDDNGRAISLYERCGYRQFGRKPGYYADGTTALRFEKALGARTSGDRNSTRDAPGSIL